MNGNTPTGSTGPDLIPDVPAVMPEMVLKPSLKAALDVPFKVLLVFLFVGVPALAPLFASGNQGLAIGLLTGLQSFGGLIAVASTAGPAIQLIFTRYRLDEEGITVTFQIFQKNEQRVQWEKVTALRHRRTVMDRVLRIERLDVVAYGASGTTLRLVGLRRAAELRDLCSDKMLRSASMKTLFAND